MAVDIPGYTILKPLGKGGMATVYLARQAGFERQVALKVMSPALADNPQFGQRFLREARIVSQLAHPNIVSVFDLGFEDNLYYLSMAYIDGPDLKQAQPNLSWQQKLTVMADVAKALAFAGERGFVHRDIKPENIMIDRVDGRAVLMDFGIARAAENDLAMTQTGMALGTPHYMSPEQAKGQPVDPRSDLYSLGVVFYFLLTGDVPYKADSAVAIGIKHITEPVPSLPSYSASVQRLLAKLMAKSPDQRYQSASALLQDLAKIDGTQGAVSVAPSAEDLSEAETMVSVDMALRIREQAATGIKIWRRFRETWQPRRVWGYWQSLGNGLQSIAVAALIVLAGVVTWGLFADTDQPRQSELAGVTEEPAPSAPAAIAEQIEASPEPLAEPAEQNDGADQPRSQPRSVTGTEQLGRFDFIGRLNRRVKDLGQALGGKPQESEERLEVDAADLASEVAVLRERLAANPDDSKARQRLAWLAQQQANSLAELLSQARFDEADDLWQRSRALLPELERNREYRDIKQRLERVVQLRPLMNKAQRRWQQGHYLTPTEDSAYFYYQRALNLDPELTAARQGVQRIGAALAEQAQQAYSQGRWEDARVLVADALAVAPEQKVARDLALKLSRLQAQTDDPEPLVATALRHIAAGHLVTPTRENALYYLQQARSVAPSNPLVEDAFARFHQAFADRLWAQVAEGHHDDARDSLAKAQAAGLHGGEFNALRNAVVQAMADQVAQREPQIAALSVDSAQVIQPAPRQAPRLRARRTLYAALRYAHFPSDTDSVVEAVLRRAGDDKPVLEVPVIIPGGAGDTFFRLDRPREGFAAGDYVLQLRDGATVLQEARFAIVD